jgi:hypothetical protein
LLQVKKCAETLSERSENNSPLTALITQVIREGLERGESPYKFRAIGIQLGPKNAVSFYDPKLVQELITVHAESYDKSETFRDVFQDLLGESFLFSKGDDNWR